MALQQVARRAGASVLQRPGRVDDRVARLRLHYRHSELGRDLLEAGHVTGSRVYAAGMDPFKWPRAMRAAAFDGMGVEYDDNAAFPRARAAMKPGPMTRLFIANKDEVLNPSMYVVRQAHDATPFALTCPADRFQSAGRRRLASGSSANTPGTVPRTMLRRADARG